MLILVDRADHLDKESFIKVIVIVSFNNKAGLACLTFWWFFFNIV